MIVFNVSENQKLKTNAVIRIEYNFYVYLSENFKGIPSLMLGMALHVLRVFQALAVLSSVCKGTQWKTLESFVCGKSSKELKT